MTLNNFQYHLRTQFTLTANDATLAKVLREIAAKRVNITGYMQTKINREDVRLVACLPSGESEFDRCVVREALKKNGVRFSEQQVILIPQIAPGTPGVIVGSKMRS